MKTFTLELPDYVDVDKQELSILLMCSLYEEGKLSLSAASETLGVSQVKFTNILFEKGFSFFNQTSEELDRDIENARKSHGNS